MDPVSRDICGHRKSGREEECVAMTSVVFRFFSPAGRQCMCAVGECAGQAGPLWMRLPLKGCIVWTLTKPNWFGQILTGGQVEVSVRDSSAMFAHECAHACLCTCLICSAYIKRREREKKPSVFSSDGINVFCYWFRSSWCVALWRRISMVCPVLWCAYICVSSLATCHSSFLLQASSVNAAIYCESSPPSGSSNCFGF